MTLTIIIVIYLVLLAGILGFNYCAGKLNEKSSRYVKWLLEQREKEDQQ